MRLATRLVVTVAMALLTGLGTVVTPAPALAAEGDIGHPGAAFNGSVNVPTSDKPQSKLWYADGLWWAAMFDTTSRTWRIFRLDRATETWTNTGVLVDDRPNTLADTLWDGTHLYIASHVVTISSDTTAKPSVANSPARFLRYSYDSATKSFALDAGFPATITTQSSESMTIDKDSTGRIWATWTQVSGSSATGFTSAVYVNATAGSDSSWGTPFVMPTAGAQPAPDDLSAVVAFGRNRIGILWSNQIDDTVYWAVHNDGGAVGDWRVSPAIRGNRQADDHLNLKAVQADAAGRVFAVVKTGADDIAGAPPAESLIRLLVFKPGTGAWTSSDFGTLADCHTRPQVVLDEQQSTVHVVATAPTGPGCAYSGAPGTIYQKSAPMDDPVFAPGRGTPIIRDAASDSMNDATTTKQSVNGASGLVVLAANTATRRYWHADLALGGGTPPPPAPAPAPTASFTASPTSGVAPLVVQFTDTSTAAPTSWTWDFGDGATATTQNPAHTYAAAGNYTVTLRATNASATSPPATQTVSVSTAPPPPAGVSVGAVTTALSTTALSAVTIPVPAGTVDGDVLLAQFTADNSPAVTAPAGWSSVLPSSYIGMGGGARVFAYYHVVGSAVAEPPSYTWQLSSPQKWNAGMAGFHGVSPTDPFDTAAVVASDSTYSASRLTVPGLTTVTPGALLVGGVGLDRAMAAVAQPIGWTEAFESAGAQLSEMADQSRPTAGTTGAQTWTFSTTAASAGWMRALRPA